MTTSTSKRRRLVVPIAVVVASGASLAALSSGAWFTDSDTVPNNSFSTGNVSLDATPDTAALTATNMAPGDIVVAPLTVTNDGSLALKYTVSGEVTGTAAAALKTTVKSGVTTCTAAGFDATGTVIYGAATIPTTKTQLAARGTVAAGANEKLCFKVELPGAATGNTYQNTSATAVYTFDATQPTAP